MNTKAEDIDASFRDSIATVTKEGKRVWIYPKKPGGRFHKARIIVTVFLLAFLFAAPFIKINGFQLILLNFIERKFIFFGLAFGPQDLHLFVLAMIASIVFIFLFTAVFGRVFCGWICPQTVFMEMVFRKIEYWIEGDHIRQKLLKKMPWNAGKIFKKGSKLAIFYAISVIISNTFLAYIIGTDELMKIITDPVSMHLGGFIAMLIFSYVFFWVFASFREQACTIVCPYGRLQGVLLDPNSVVIAYDFVRGEPRGKFKKSENRTIGDCVNCRQCVDVCPTGIDIRNGTQLECVNCTACIDACDSIMDSLKMPKGLIRYASLNNIKNKLKFKLTPRIIGYSALLIVLVTVLVTLIVIRSDVSVTILRTPGLLYQEQPNNMVSNLYSVKLANKTFHKIPIRLQLINMPGEIKLVGNDIIVDENNVSENKFFISLPRNGLKKMNTPVEIAVFTGEKQIEIVTTSFLGPNPEENKQ